MNLANFGDSLSFFAIFSIFKMRISKKLSKYFVSITTIFAIFKKDYPLTYAILCILGKVFKHFLL